MKKHLYVFAIAVLALVFACTNEKKSNSVSNNKDFTQYVNPKIGTGDHGHVFLGANVPFGFVQLGPTQMPQGWDWCSGYNYADTTIRGFSHMHLSGTGIGDLGDITIMPAVGDVLLRKGDANDERSGFFSTFSHSREIAKPGFYSVHLNRYNIDVELTATTRVGFSKFIFPKSDNATIIFDIENGIGWDKYEDGNITIENDTTVSGYRFSKGWAASQKVYFVAKLSKPFESEIRSFDGSEIGNTYAQIKFSTRENEAVFMKVAISPVSIENAKQNLATELPDWDFDKTVAAANTAWNNELSKINFETDNAADREIFYTALYHTMIAPATFCDVNGDYYGADGKIHNDKSFTNYTTFSLWDTYRAAQPLMTIIHPEKAKDIAATMLNIFAQQGKLPVWHLVGNETNCMVGNPGIPALVDIALKYPEIDKEKVFEAAKASALCDDRGLNLLKQYGYLPYDKDGENETVAKGMEYALADACVALLAKQLGKTDDYNYFAKRARAYEFYFDKKTKFVRGCSSDGSFREPFNPFHSTHRVDDYTEGNAWQYTWLVPHDVNNLVALMGGEDAFIAKLDSLFIVNGDLGKDASPDISGLIGQYAHGNEPSHHILYMYDFVGQPWKTADKIRQVLTTLYHNAPAGLCGNEDVGQMSAWYILSSMGFYQVAPAGGVYVFGSPIMNKATINVGNGKTFTIIANNNSRKNKYIQSAKLNGEKYTKNYILHSDIAAGGTLEFEMGAEPSKTFGVAESDRPKDNML